MRTPKQSVEITEVVEWRDGAMHRVTDYLATEEPLEIRIVLDGRPGRPLSVTMRTPGCDLELAAGFLLTEGIIDTADQLTGIRSLTNDVTGKNNMVEAEISGSDYDLASMQRNFFAASSCGICGKASIESIRRRGFEPRTANFESPPQRCAR